MKRKATDKELLEAPTLPVIIPASAHKSDPISHGTPDLYLEEDFRKVATIKQPRTDEFEKRLVGLWWRTGEPVPFVFKTADGAIRSLDAGCIGFLLNRPKPEISVIKDGQGYVTAVIPISPLAERHFVTRDKLVAAVSAE